MYARSLTDRDRQMRHKIGSNIVDIGFFFGTFLHILYVQAKYRTLYFSQSKDSSV